MTNLANAIALTAAYAMHLSVATKPLSPRDFAGLFCIALAEFIRAYS